MRSLVRVATAGVNGMLLCVHMALVGAPAVRVVPCDAKRLQESLQAQKDIILPPAEPIRQDIPGVVINRMPQPPLVGLCCSSNSCREHSRSTTLQHLRAEQGRYVDDGVRRELP